MKTLQHRCEKNPRVLKIGTIINHYNISNVPQGGGEPKEEIIGAIFKGDSYWAFAVVSIAIDSSGALSTPN